MLINISTSKENKEKISKLSQKFLGAKERNIIARIALGFSLQTGKKFSKQEFSTYSSGGQEYKDANLFSQQYKPLFIALICQYYNIRKTDEDISKYVKLHIDHGVEIIYQKFENDDKYTIIDFLKDYLDKGISFLEENEINLDYVKNHNQELQKDYFTGSLGLLIGKTLKDEKDIYLNLNSSVYNNSHIAIAGSTGTGKTRFAFHLLSEITKVSSNKVNFIYLDFKGIKGEDVNRYTPFFEQTQTNFIDIPATKFPVNPLSFANNVNEVERKMGIDKFTDIICKYSNLGVKQKGNLREATVSAFNEKKMGEYPTIPEIRDKLYEIVGEKLDSLTEIMNDLSRYEIFKDRKEKHKSFLNENIYLSLSGELPNPLRFTSLFLIINYIRNVFMNMEDTPIDENGFRAIRYVVLIDEAHVIFKERKYQDILEKMLREIRSKGVSIIMLSQGVDEFNQPSFDFSEMCEISILLGIKDKNNTKAINKFMGVSEKEGVKIMRSLEKINKGQAIANIRENIDDFSKGDLFDIKQFSS